jgi:hypothetical protein
MSEDNKPEKSNGQWHGGKGSVQKPNEQDKFADGWDAIWGKKKKPGELSDRERLLMDPPLYKNDKDKKDGDT